MVTRVWPFIYSLWVIHNEYTDLDTKLSLYLTCADSWLTSHHWINNIVRVSFPCEGKRRVAWFAWDEGAAHCNVASSCNLVFTLRDRNLQAAAAGKYWNEKYNKNFVLCLQESIWCFCEINNIFSVIDIIQSDNFQISLTYYNKFLLRSNFRLGSKNLS